MTEFRDSIATKRTLPKLPLLNIKKVVSAYEKAKNRLIISDYDGTLTGIQSLPQLAQPASTLVEILRTLSTDPRNTVFIMSGRERRFLERWLGQLNVGLAAEYGFYHRMPGQSEWQSIGEEIDVSWKELVQPIMQYFTERTPGTYIEAKEASLAWHYKDADPHFGAWQAKDMQISMEDVLSNLPLEIIQGNHIVEVRHRAVSKARVLEVVLAHLQSERSIDDHDGNEVDFIFCVGDDRSDEDMFHALNQWRESDAPDDPARGNRDMDATALQSSPTSSQPLAVQPVPPLPPLPPPEPLPMLPPPRLRSRAQVDLFNVHIGQINDASQATSYVDNTIELRRVLRAFSSVSKKDSDLRDLGVLSHAAQAHN